MVKKVQRERASEREGELVERRQPGQQNWRHDGVAERQQRIVVGVVLVVIRSGVITAGENGEPNEVLKLTFAPHRTLGVTSRSPAVLVTFATPSLSGARGATSASRPGGRRMGPEAAHEARTERRRGPHRPLAEAQRGQRQRPGSQSGGGWRPSDREEPWGSF